MTDPMVDASARDSRVSTAILVVNGGVDPAGDHWLRLGVERVRRHTQDVPYRLYVWNNNVSDSWPGQFLANAPDAVFMEAAGDPLPHPHAVPLQRLYERARSDGVRYVVTLDSDAEPVRDGWLSEAIAALEGGAALAGIWRDELRATIEPYVHPSCLVTSVDFIERNGLRLDFIAPNVDRNHDTLSSLTDKALELGLPIRKLLRSNRNQVHHLIGGLYGDAVYHHGAGSRTGIHFWGQPAEEGVARRNAGVRDGAAELWIRHNERHLAWLRGRVSGAQTTEPLRFLAVLGMHRSGTSCLAGCLARCGLHLGDVSLHNPHNRRGNHERDAVTQLHERILASNGGAWDRPPVEIELSGDDRALMRSVVEELLSHPPAGFKDPRSLLVADAWKEIVPSSAWIGTFRHPAAVARSLHARDAMPEEPAYELWCRYNRELVRLHRREAFPLVEFELSDVDRYVETVAAAAIALGLSPDLVAIREFVSQELDHDVGSTRAVPETCREIYDYLVAHRFQPSPYERALLPLLIPPVPDPPAIDAAPNRTASRGGMLRAIVRRVRSAIGAS